MANCPKCHFPLSQDAAGKGCPRCLFSEGVFLAAVSYHRQGKFLPLEPTELDLIFDEYDIEALIGRGGMGAVYRIRDVANGEVLAMKILPPENAANPELLERFYTEASALEQLSHPNIVRLHEVGDREGFAYFVMEHVEGEDLARFLFREKKLFPRDALSIMVQISLALEYAHEKGIVHRDLKPANILIAQDGQVKVADFGLAKIRQEEGDEPGITHTHSVMGTAHYLAPELRRAGQNPEPTVDIYSLAVILYEMLTGEIPAGRFDLPSALVPGLNVRTDAVIAKALNPNPERRHQEIGVFARDFGEAMKRKRRIGPVLAIAGLVLFLAGAFFLVRFENKPDSEASSVVLFGTVLVEELGSGNDPASLQATLSPESSAEIKISSFTNRGDYWLNMPNDAMTSLGTLITTVAENGRDDNGLLFLAKKQFATSSFTVGGNPPSFVISLHRVGNSQEENMNTAFAWFPYDQFLAAYYGSLPKSRTFVNIGASDEIELGSEVIPGREGFTKVDLREHGADSDHGILMANVGENADYFAQTRPLLDGTFDILVSGNDDSVANYSDHGISFVFLSLEDIGKNGIVSLGRVESGGATSIHAGSAVISQLNFGRWSLKIPEEKMKGILILTPISTEDGNNQNNVISYQWDEGSASYIVESRDLGTMKLEGGASPDEPMFNFVFLRN